MKRLPILVSLILATGALAACGDDEGDDSPGASGQADTQQQPAATGPRQPAAAGPLKISIRNTAYEPRTVTAKVGQTITWTNDDPIAHTVTRQGMFDSGTLNSGATFTYKPTRAGTIEYICTIHPGQTGTVRVES